MAWEDVPEKLTQYENERYAPENARATLLAFYGATELDDVKEFLRDDLEKDLDYRLGACINLRNSRAIHPRRLER